MFFRLEIFGWFERTHVMCTAQLSAMHREVSPQSALRQGRLPGGLIEFLSLYITKNERISEFGMYEQTDLVEFYLTTCE